MGYLSLVNTEVNWLLWAFALSRSFVIGLSVTLRFVMPMFSRLFALMNDHNRNNIVGPTRSLVGPSVSVQRHGPTN